MAEPATRRRSQRTKKQTQTAANAQSQEKPSSSQQKPPSAVKRTSKPPAKPKRQRRILIVVSKPQEPEAVKAVPPRVRKPAANAQSTITRRSSQRTRPKQEETQQQQQPKQQQQEQQEKYDDAGFIPATESETTIPTGPQTSSAEQHNQPTPESSKAKVRIVGKNSTSTTINKTSKPLKLAPAPASSSGKISEPEPISGTKQRQFNYKYKQERLRRFTEDSEIMMEWLELEKLIATYVREVLVDVLPMDLDKDGYPFLALEHLTDLALPMCQTKRYAPCLFEISVWNFLTRKFFSVGALNWAYEMSDNHKPGQVSETQGLAAVMRNLTYIWGTSVLDTTKEYRKRLDFFEWRRNTVDFVFETLVSHARCEEMANNVIFEMLWTWMPFFKKNYMKGDATAWGALILETSRIVNAAENLAVKMRRSADGVWSPFIPKGGSQFKPNVVEVYWNQIAKPMQPDQKKYNNLNDEKNKRLFQEAQKRAQHPQPDSKVTLTVVPGLHKYVVQRSPENRDLSVVEVEVMRPAMCFFDLALEDVVNRHMVDEEDEFEAEMVSCDE